MDRVPWFWVEMTIDQPYNQSIVSALTQLSHWIYRDSFKEDSQLWGVPHTQQELTVFRALFQEAIGNQRWEKVKRGTF